ncbi:hypothetical protein SAMN03080617_03124 [Algoriphagus alkaliphilus]|uniref:Uncharacterized protein n=2 Tax=Algoriphagus alkaliphilus TaxID=279824 RepID=A0A1G5Z1D4_9BACT|nr:hypothetical protein SAMN03080617_03124 [Algoriphagus alkaliphilus]
MIVRLENLKIKKLKGFLSQGMKINIFFSIELAFNVLLIFEAMSLIFLFPDSVADSVGKQFEIISLILLRDAFKEFGHYLGDVNISGFFLCPDRVL